MNRVQFLLSLVIILILACSKDELQTIPEPTNTNLKYFGFSLINVFFDDPKDGDAKTNYIDEVAHFSNLADILVFDPEQDIVPNLVVFSDHDVKAYLHVSEIFFEIKEMGGDKSGVIYKLREDCQERWSIFIQTNQSHLNFDNVQAFYIGEEPFWNGISFEDLEKATSLLKSDFPLIKTMVIEAYAALSELEVPSSVDWVGFDHYFIKDPLNDEGFQSEIDLLKSKISEQQDIILVLDAHFNPLFHRLGGITKNNLDEVARSYYQLANSDPQVIGILGYHWPSGFDFDNVTGARDLPDHVLHEYEQIGKAITKK